MLFGNRGPRSKGKRQRKNEAYRPRAEKLEEKLLLAIDLGGAQLGSLPAIATAPIGVLEANAQSASQGAGWSVTNLGSINGTGFDSFLIGAPSVALQSTGLGTIVSPTAGGNAEAYLVFGSQSVSTGIFNWLNLTSNQRVGDLFNNLGTTPQNNPITGTTGFDFQGVKFIASQQTGSLLGASGAFIGPINGSPAFLIGAPNAKGLNNGASGAGRVYMVYGPGLATIGGAAPIDLDNPTGHANITIVTFETSVAGSLLGQSVAGLGNFLNTGTNAIALGAPGASVANLPNSGAVYVISSAVLSGLASGAVINVAAVGQTGGIAGLTIGGASAGDQAGFSVASAGNVNGASNGVQGIDDLLIGAPHQGTTAGTAYLIYGGNLASFTRTITVNGSAFTYLPLNTVGGQVTTNSAPAAIFTGTTAGDFTGYSVATAGDFNNDRFADIQIGSPGANSNAGTVTVVYGAANNAVSGTIPLNNIPTTVRALTLTGANAGDLAGFSEAPVSRIPNSPGNEIIIGAPGFNSLLGTAYLIPGRTGTLTGTLSLSAAEAAPLDGVQFFMSTPGAPTSTPPFFGASVSGRPVTSGQTVTADADLKGDFIIGSPGFFSSTPSGVSLGGAGPIVEGASLILTNPPTAGIVTTIVQIDTSTTSPFAVNATTPDNMDIFVTSTSTTTPPFNPLRDINPATVVVNGVAFPTATIRADPNNANNAIITITPRSALALNPNVTSLTISGSTLSTSPLAGQTWTATAAITVTGGSVIPPFGGVASLPPPGLFTPSVFIPPLGTNFVPSVTSLSTYNYAPLPLRVALQQFFPPDGFSQRIFAYNNPGKTLSPTLVERGQPHSHHSSSPTGVWTLGWKVFTRGRFHAGKTYQWTHKAHGTLARIVPQQESRQRYTSQGNPLGRV
jgi:hypothetical protein